MKRLLRFFLLMSLRVIAVMTLILWGTSQVQRVRFLAPVGSAAVELETYSDGCFVALIFRPNAPFRLDFQGDDQLSLSEVADGQSSFFGLPLWLGGKPKAVFCAAAYWLVIVLAVIAYGIVEYFGRRRGKGLVRLSSVAEKTASGV